MINLILDNLYRPATVDLDTDLQFQGLIQHKTQRLFKSLMLIFFAYSHGSFQTMVYDNMKVAVRRFVDLTEKEPQ